MSGQKRFRIVLFFVVGFFLSRGFADGVLVPVRPNFKGYFDIVYHHVKMDIHDQTMQVRVEQAFYNPTNRAEEATYLFPIPEKAVIKSFTMTVNGKTIEGKILPKDQANHIYQEIVRKRKDPALLEYMGRGVYKASIYPLPPKKEAKVEIRYFQVLRSVGKNVEVLYPLSTEKYSSKAIKEVVISGKIREKDLGVIYSPSHRVSVHRKRNSVATFSYEEKGTKPNTDFLLYYGRGQESRRFFFLNHQNAEKENFFFMLYSPPETKQKSLPKDIVLVVDTSGSMDGEKIEQARQAALFFIHTVGKQDRLNIILFNDGVESLFPSLKPQGEVANQAVARIKSVLAGGGTNIHEALLKALSYFRGGRPSYIVFLTDGEPTVGVQKPAKIVDDVRQANKKGVKLFVFGVGYDVNTVLLDKLALQNHGDREYVRPKENIEVKVSALLKKVQHPFLTHTQVQFSFPTSFVYPKQLPDLFAGSDLILVGKYKGQGKGSVTLQGVAQKKKRKISFAVRRKKGGHSFIELLWAQRRIGYLLDIIRLKGEKEELTNEVIALSKKYGIVTPYTSFLAEEDVVLSEADMKSTLKKNLSRTIGKKAVGGSQAANMAQKTGQINQMVGVGSSTKVVLQMRNQSPFFLKKGAWMQSTYQKQPTRKIKFLSEEYFKLLQDPVAARFLSNGKQVIFFYKGEWIEITL